MNWKLEFEIDFRIKTMVGTRHPNFRSGKTGCELLELVIALLISNE